MSVAPQVTITSVDPVGMRVTLELVEEVAKPSANPRYTVTDRPKGKSLVELDGLEPNRMTLPCTFDKFMTQESVEAEMETLRRMSRTVVAGERGVSCKVSGPVPLTGVVWHIESLDWGDYDRRPDGATVRAYVTVGLLENVMPALLVTSTKTAAQKVAEAAKPSTSTSKTYTVKQGDTLTSIAVRVLGKASRWTEIADLNKLRDPKSVRSGQVLRLP